MSKGLGPLVGYAYKADTYTPEALALALESEGVQVGAYGGLEAYLAVRATGLQRHKEIASRALDPDILPQPIYEGPRDALILQGVPVPLLTPESFRLKRKRARAVLAYMRQASTAR